jgi:membrane protein
MNDMKTILLESFRCFRAHQDTRFAAAIAYYMIFCSAPLFVFVLSILNFFLHDPAINAAFFGSLHQLFGKEASTFLQENVHAASTEASIWLTGFGVFLGLLGASAVFKELKSGLDTIFEVARPKRKLVPTLIRNLITFGTVIVIGLFLLVSLLSTMALSIMGPYLQDVLGLNTELIELVNFGFSFIILTAFFMVLHTFVPDTNTPFRLSLFGSVITALLFTLGKTLFGLYLATIGIHSGYGAAGSILILLLWIFYSAQIFLFGAEITAQIKKNKKVLEKIL